MVRPQTTTTTRRSERRDGRYKGVRMRKWGKWVAEVRQPNSRDRIWLGSYDTADEAARAYDAAVFCLRGPSAVLNFPDDPPDILSADELSPSQIQVAASKHAHRLMTGPPVELKQPKLENLFFGGGATEMASSSFGEYHGGEGYMAADGAGGDGRVAEADISIGGGVFFDTSRMWSF